jgi:hypothetical protein
MGAPTHFNAGWGRVKDSEHALTIHDVRAFRNRTPIGTRVRFETEEYVAYEGSAGTRKIKKHVEGTITGKFPQVVVLDGKHTYTWKELMLNNVEILEQ